MKSSPSSMVFMREVAHGTNAGYTNGKCRCDECRRAHREYANRYTEKNSARLNEKRRAKYADDPEPAKKAAKEWRDKNIDQVRAHDRRRYWDNRENELEYRRVHYILAREAYIERAAKWKKNNPERAREIDEASRQRAKEADPEGYALREAERMRKSYYKDVEASRARARAYAQTPTGKANAYANRARRRGAPFTEEALEWIRGLVDPVCTYCGAPATQIDHIVPVAKGGTGDITNLTPACAPCNQRKNARSVESFLRLLEQEALPSTQPKETTVAQICSWCGSADVQAGFDQGHCLACGQFTAADGTQTIPTSALNEGATVDDITPPAPADTSEPEPTPDPIIDAETATVLAAQDEDE